MKNSQTLLWQQYQEGINHNSQMRYNTIADLNERFYRKDQWAGIKTNGLPAPVIDICNASTNQAVAYLTASPIKAVFKHIDEDMAFLATKAVQSILKQNDFAYTLQKALIDAALCGDMATHTIWDSTIDVGNGVKGDIVVEKIDGCNVFVENPQNEDIESQVYIIIAGTQSVEKLKEEAKRYKKSPELIKSDRNDNQIGEKRDSTKQNLATFLIKYEKKDGKIYKSKGTSQVMFYEDVDTGLSFYPVNWGNWESAKNSYHGTAHLTSIIPNQIAINKSWAMAIKSLMDMAFPKVIYDKTKISRWSNAVAEAIAVNGDIDRVARTVEGYGARPEVTNIINQFVQETNNSLGSTDAFLGKMANPQNASAIVAAQQGSVVRLELLKRNLYRFVENQYRIVLDFTTAYYSVPRVISFDTSKGNLDLMANMSVFKDMELSVAIDAGASTPINEVLQMQKLDELLFNKIITTKQYLERYPAGIIPDTQALIQENDEMAQMQEMIAQMQGGQGMPQQGAIQNVPTMAEIPALSESELMEAPM